MVSTSVEKVEKLVKELLRLLHGSPMELLTTVIASQTHRVVKALMKVRGSNSHVVAKDSQSSSSPRTVANTMNKSDVGIKHRIKK